MNAFPDWLVLCVWRALMGEVYPAIRAIAISLSDDRELLIRSVAVAISEQGHAYAQWFPAADQTALRVLCFDCISGSCLNDSATAYITLRAENPRQ